MKIARTTIISRMHATPVRSANLNSPRISRIQAYKLISCSRLSKQGMTLIGSPSASRLPDKRLKAIEFFFYKKQEINLCIRQLRSCRTCVSETSRNCSSARCCRAAAVIILRGRRYIARFRYDNLPHAHRRLGMTFHNAAGMYRKLGQRSLHAWRSE